MTTFCNTLSLLRQQMTSYSQYAGDEFWKPAYLEADACKDLEATIALGLGIYRCINKLTAGKELESEVLDLVKWWIGPCEAIESRIRRFEKLGYKVDGASDFRWFCDQARALVAQEPTTWRGRKIHTEEELRKLDIQLPPEPE